VVLKLLRGLHYDTLHELESVETEKFASKQAEAKAYRRLLDEFTNLNREAISNGNELDTGTEPKSIDDHERQQFYDSAGGPNFGSGY
jgi:hypothetical protein